MKIEKTAIEGVLLITPDVYEDERGHFLEIYSEAKYLQHGIGPFVQDNESLSKQGVLRGLHFQRPPYEQGKLVRCVEGTIVDVAVDLRLDSPTYGKHVMVQLSGTMQLWIPPGFAHGFVVISNRALVQYKTTNVYSKAHEGGILWNDDYLKIPWPISDPVLSDKDSELPSLKEAMPPDGT